MLVFVARAYYTFRLGGPTAVLVCLWDYAMSQRLKLGDIFEVYLDGSTVRYFQYVAKDSSQLDSHVVRVFRESYAVDAPVDTSAILAGEIDFHAHVYLQLGMKQDLWQKVDHAPPPSDLDIIFRDSDDYGNPDVEK